MSKTKVAVGADHAGFQLKKILVSYLQEKGFEILDCGVDVVRRCDYPDFAHSVCQKIQQNEAQWGLLLCGTGIGMSMAANKHKGIRAAVVSEPFSALATRQHNDANVLCLGERVVGIGVAMHIIDAWCSGIFEGDRHQERIDKMTAFEAQLKNDF